MKNVSIIFFALIVIYGIRYSSLQLTRRYNLQPDDVSLTSLQIESKIKEINKLNIPNKARFIVAPGPTQNGGLFFLNKEGWNIDKIENIKLDTILSLKNQGASFFLINDQKQQINSDDFGVLIYEVDGIKIIKL